MGGASNALTYGVGSTEYANLVHNQFAFVKVPESIRFELTGKLDPGCTAKDVILHILWHYAKHSDTLDRSMEFGGPGLASISMDERATLCNMATECSAKTGICDPDQLTIDWLLERRDDLTEEEIRSAFVYADEDAHYDGGVHTIDLDEIRPMVAHPGNPDEGVPSDPTNIFDELKPLGSIKSMLYPPTLLCVVGQFSSISAPTLCLKSINLSLIHI